MDKIAKKCKACIKLILTAIKRFNQMNHSSGRLIGDLGEFYVFYELLKHGYSPQFKGGAAGYDIEMYIGGKIRRIEVKTGTQNSLRNLGFYKQKGVKSEMLPLYYECSDAFGWTIKHKRKNVKFDFLVCVGISKEGYTPLGYYIFTREEMKSFKGIRIRRYKKTPNEILVLVSDIRNLKSILRDSGYKKVRNAFSKDVLRINLNKAKHLNRWGKIK